LKLVSTYRIATKAIIYLLVIGQLWANAATFCQWMVDPDSELIELCNTDDAESEKEESKEEKNDKLTIDMYDMRLDNPQNELSVLHSKDLLSLHDPDVTTPPPESVPVLS